MLKEDVAQITSMKTRSMDRHLMKNVQVDLDLLKVNQPDLGFVKAVPLESDLLKVNQPDLGLVKAVSLESDLLKINQPDLGLIKAVPLETDLFKINLPELGLLKAVPLGTGLVKANTAKPSLMKRSSLGSTRTGVINDRLLETISQKDIIAAQREDIYTSKIIEGLGDNPVGTYFMHEGLLYKERNFIRSQRYCLVVPYALRQNVLRMCHDDMGGGHLGIKKTWPKIKERFYWATMYKDTVRWLKSCRLCAMRKTPKVTKIPLGIIDEADKPFDMVGVDLLGPLPETPRGNKYACVFSDYNSRWPEVAALKDKKTTSVAKCYINEVVSRHGGSKTLLSDQGGEFRSNLVKDICAYLKTCKVNTTAYHPQCNGLTERFNGTLCQIISIYAELNQQNWDELLPLVLFAYRTAVQESATLSPFEILYNRTPRLPNDLDLVKIESKEVKEFDKNWKLAKEKVREAGEKSKSLLKAKYREKTLEIGDNVRMLSLPTKVGLKYKLRGDLWTGPFKIIGKLPNGNLLLNIFKSSDKDKARPYVTHPDRLKLAETNYKNEMDYLAEVKRRKENPSVKTVRFSEKVVYLEPLEKIKKKVTFFFE